MRSRRYCTVSSSSILSVWAPTTSGKVCSLQLQQFDPGTPWLKEAGILIRDHFNLLSNHDYTSSGSKMKLASDDLQHVIHLIQSLNPRPGSRFNTTEPEYIIPDVYVVKKKAVAG